MAKLTLNDVTSGYASSTAVNTNNTLVEEALENTLSRDGTGPNAMGANLDMNSHKIINLAAPVASADAARLVDVQAAVSGLPTASLVPFSPYVNIAATTVQGAIEEEIDDLASSTGSDLIGHMPSGTGAVALTVKQQLRNIQGWEVNICDAPYYAVSGTDSTAAIQAAIDSGASRIKVPGGDYKIYSTLTITNKTGFQFVGDGMSASSLSWYGAAGGTILTMRGTWFSTIKDLWFNCNGIADTAINMPCYRAADGDTHVATMNSVEHCRLGGTRAGTGTGVIIGDAVGSQLDNLNFYKCWFENAGKLVSITGGVTLHINFDNCVFSGYSVIPTTVGVDIISGGLVNFSKCQFVGNGPTIAYVQRSITALNLTFDTCEMESDGKFLYCPDDTAFANNWPVTLNGCVIGFTGTAATNFIDYRQRGALIINGGTINSSNAANLNHNPPAAGMLHDTGVRYINTTIVQGTYSIRKAVTAAGVEISQSASGNVTGPGVAASGVVQTFVGSSADDTLSRLIAHKAGGNSATTTQCSQTTTDITTAKAICALELPSFIMVRGSDGTNEFFDLLISSNSGTPTVLHSVTTAGSPAARTYSLASFNLKLAMASGTYTTNVHWFQISAR